MITLDRSQIEELVDLDNAQGAIEKAYISASDGTATIPPVGYIEFPEQGGDCHIKYGYIQGDPIFVIKVAAGFYRNPSIGLPTSSGVMLALSAETGRLEAILLDEGFLTDLRTGIGGAIATKALCRPNSRRVAIIGTGIQARLQIRCLNHIMNEAELSFGVWGRSAVRAEEVVGDLAHEDIRVEVVEDIETLCRNADIIITTTPAREPIIRDEWVHAGTHITAIGADAPGKQELESALVTRADRKVVDRTNQSLEHGEFSAAFSAGLIKENDCVELGAILSGRSVGRTNSDEITIADLTGVAVQDIAIARSILDIYELSKKINFSTQQGNLAC